MGELVSVIIPIYNVEEYLEECISSVCNQTYKNIEIILVNDGSTDSSKNICEKWELKDNRIIVINKDNGGLSSARNVGIKQSKGSYITFIDSDDYVEETFIEEMLQQIKKENSDIAICNRYYHYENKKNYLKYKDDNTRTVMNRKESIVSLLKLEKFDMSAWAKLYKIELFKDIIFPEGKLCEDYYIMYKLFDLCNSVVYFSKPLYYYRQRRQSITKTKGLKMDFIYAAKEQMEYIENKYPDLQELARSRYILSHLTVYSLNYYNGGKLTPEEKQYFQNTVKSNIKYIKNAELIKKIQAYLFVSNKFIYNQFYRIYKFIKK